MAINRVIEDINDFLDYNNKSRAEFVVAITHIENEIDDCILKGRFIEAFKMAKLLSKFKKLYSKKLLHDNKEEFKNLRGKH